MPLNLGYILRLMYVGNDFTFLVAHEIMVHPGIDILSSMKHDNHCPSSDVC